MFFKTAVVSGIVAIALSGSVYAASAGHPADAGRNNPSGGAPPPGPANGNRNDNQSSGTAYIAQVPELGGASAGLALLLLGGLVALRRETRKAF